ncbi:hypothetical protein UABAM_06650 [Candidatus Uabimicrobium amorphum]|uniref:Uncharacterized protein n=1 Tax=Uabimicrobium amorphum TaxID=2596890 RepID=A0A5S9IU95_UABAM|nr:hypothetical protein UABAM_06650 [Candidatus Uabimicrobium amorphum]
MIRVRFFTILFMEIFYIDTSKKQVFAVFFPYRIGIFYNVFVRMFGVLLAVIFSSRTMILYCKLLTML